MLSFYCKYFNKSFSFLLFLLLILQLPEQQTLSLIASNLPVVSDVTSNNSPLSSVSVCYFCFIAVKNHNCSGIFLLFFFQELALMCLFSLLSDNGMTNVVS